MNTWNLEINSFLFASINNSEKRFLVIAFIRTKTRRNKIMISKLFFKKHPSNIDVKSTFFRDCFIASYWLCANRFFIVSNLQHRISILSIIMTIWNISIGVPGSQTRKLIISPLSNLNVSLVVFMMCYESGLIKQETERS